MSTTATKLNPSPFLGNMRAYQALRFTSIAPVDLYLEGNEGPAPPPEILEELAAEGPEIIRRYPNPRPLEMQLARMLGVEPERLIVTAGADDALERAIRAVGCPGREMILPVPTFEMIGRYAQFAGCDIIEVPWLAGNFPLAEITSRISDKTAIITVVTPNSPTGLAVRREDLQALSVAAPHALLLVDLAYTDFADEELTEAVLSLPNAVAIRTLSKAWGLAGLRVGFGCGNQQVIEWMRIAGHPYAVSSPSLKLAERRLSENPEEIDRFTRKVRQEREELTKFLADFTKTALEASKANFVFARFADAGWVLDSLRGLGIAVRGYSGKKYLEDAIRITLPGNQTDFDRLGAALRTVFAPEALLFDIDDTLVDVSESYRRATIQTAADFGVDITPGDITAAKAGGSANNDWELTHRLIREKGGNATLREVTEQFEKLYQGTAENAGYCQTEKMLVDKTLLERLSARYPLGIVTGRPMSDALAFLERERITHLFQTVVTMNDGPLKPDPEPVRLAQKRLGVTRVWLVGDTPDDMQSARGAGALPLGVIAPSDDPAVAEPALIRAGAGTVLTSISEIEEYLP